MDNTFIHIPIPISMYSKVCALLGGASMNSISGSLASIDPAPSNSVMPEVAAKVAKEASMQDAPAPTSDLPEGVTPSTIDAHGHPWSADLHASTGSKTKEGLWRMKPGVSRPDPLPGFPKEDGAPPTGTASSASSSATAQAAEQPTAAPADEDDEFAAFTAAAAATTTASETPPRKWTDADLGKLCNQAAVKLNSPDPVREIIAEFVPEGETAHSRNIVEADREAFAKAIEAKAGITFEG